MKIKLLISLALASAAYVGAMTSDNDSCLVYQDSVQVKNDSVLYDPAQGHIFDRNIDGWVVQSCPSIVIYSCVDSYGVHGKFKLNGNKQTSNPENSTPWWIQE